MKLIAAACLFTVSTVCLAQASAPASAAKKALIDKLLTMQQPALEQLARDIIQRPMVPLMQSAGQALQQVPADKREATAKTLEADIKKFADEAVPMVKASAVKLAPATIGGLLDERFTEDELRQVIAWMESPVSKKFGAVQPELQKALVEKIMAENGPALDARFKTLQQTMGKTLSQSVPQGAAPGAAPAAKPASAPAKAAPVKK